MKIRQFLLKRAVALVALLTLLTGTLPVPSLATSEFLGTMSFVSALDNGKRIDVQGNSTDAGTQITIYDANGTTAQDFNLTDAGDDFVFIHSVNDPSMVLDIWGGAALDAPIKLSKLHGGDNQKWKFIAVGNGYYLIKSCAGEMYMDVEFGVPNNGARLITHGRNEANGTANQWFKPLSSGTPTSVIMYVNTSSSSSRLNVRQTPSTSATIVGKLTRGTRVSVLETSDGWARIQCSTASGWVSSAYLSSSIPDDSGSPTSVIMYVNTSSSSSRLNVRQTPSTSATIVGKLTRGTRVSVLETSDGWARIQCSTASGWVSSAYLSSSDPNGGGNLPENEAQILSRLNDMANGSYGNGVYKAGTRYTGTYYTEQCKGFAKRVHEILFGFNIGSTQGKPNNYKLNINSNNTSLVGSLSGLSSSSVSNLFSQARPGDFIQMRRSHGGSHSAIFLSSDANGVTVYECNTDNQNGIKVNTYSWSTFCDKNAAVSVYTAKNYYLH